MEKEGGAGAAAEVWKVEEEESEYVVFNASEFGFEFAGMRVSLSVSFIVGCKIERVFYRLCKIESVFYRCVLFEGLFHCCVLL